jgi:hypothetical protein
MLTSKDLEKIFALLTRPSLQITVNEVADYVALKQNIANAYQIALANENGTVQAEPEGACPADPEPGHQLAPPPADASITLPSVPRRRGPRKTTHKR